MRKQHQHNGSSASPSPEGIAPKPLPPLPARRPGLQPEECITALKALGESHRMRIVRHLLCQKLGVNEISTAIGLSQYNTSKHLKILKAAGLLEVEKRGTQRLYTVAVRWKDRVASQGESLELGCCTFRFGPPPGPDEPSQGRTQRPAPTR